MSNFDKSIQPSSIFVGVVEAYTHSGAPDGYPTWAGSSFAHQYKTNLKGFPECLTNLFNSVQCLWVW
jgi:hypothetical protein